MTYIPDWSETEITNKYLDNRDKEPVEEEDYEIFKEGY